MLYISKKNGDTGEIKLIVTELDRAELLCSGFRYINIDDTINAFNDDDNIKHVAITAVYAGDIKDEKLSQFMEKLNQHVISQNNNVDSNKQKVRPDGSNTDDEEEEENDDSDEELKNCLSEHDLTCPDCGEERKALIDSEGNIHSCEACIKINAYLKGKKEGFEDGYNQGYKACMEHLQKISSKIDFKPVAEIPKEKEQ